MKKIINNIKKKIKYNSLKLKSNILGFYNLKQLETKNEIIIGDYLPLKHVNNFIYIKDDALIKFSFKPEAYDKDEFIFYQKLAEIFKILEKHDRQYNICISVENRELFKQSEAIEYTKNINLIIRSDLNEYTKEEYIEEEKILDEMIEPIKNANLSPYEKYIAVYNIVKQFKEYKENPIKKSDSRYLKEILKNEYIVCVGFSSLLTALLDRVGILSISISSDVEDTSFTSLLPEELRTTILSGHKRNIIKIDDDKYNIHGIYIADPTWDNFLKADLYNNISITFDKLKESKKFEALDKYDYLLDFHSFDEYQEKINHYLNREIRYHKKESYEKRVKKSYKYLYNDILKLLYKLDNKKWQELLNKYNSLIKSIKETNTLKEIEEIYSQFLTEYGYYIIELSNKEIDINITLDAATNVKRIINEYNDEEIKEWLKLTKTIYEDVEEVSYPYIYNPNSTRIIFLESKPKRRVKTK